MKKSFLLGLAVLLTAMAVVLIASDGTTQAADDSDGRVFELRTYTTHPGKLDDLHARFRNHTNHLFVKHGIKLIGYWTPTDGEKAENTLVYLIAHDSREAAKISWRAFVSDPVWRKAYEESKADGDLVANVDSVYLSATDYSPVQ